MAENKNVNTNIENLNFTENLDAVKQYAKAVEDVLKLVDLTSNSTKT